MKLTTKELEALKVFAATAGNFDGGCYVHRTAAFTSELCKAGFTNLQAGGLIMWLADKLFTLEEDDYSDKLGDRILASVETVDELIAEDAPVDTLDTTELEAELTSRIERLSKDYDSELKAEKEYVEAGNIAKAAEAAANAEGLRIACRWARAALDVAKDGMDEEKARKWQNFWKDEERGKRYEAERLVKVRERCIENREYGDAIRATTQLIVKLICSMQAWNIAELHGKAATA